MNPEAIELSHFLCSLISNFNSKTPAIPQTTVARHWFANKVSTNLATVLCSIRTLSKGSVRMRTIYSVYSAHSASVSLRTGRIEVDNAGMHEVITDDITENVRSDIVKFVRLLGVVESSLMQIFYVFTN